MPDTPGERRATLIAGAISGDLSPAEQTELQALRAGDATIDDEIRELSAVSSLTAASLSGWDSSAPSPSLRERSLAVHDTVAAVSRFPAPGADASTTPVRRRRWLMGLAAAACVGIGAGGVLLSQPGTPTSPTGPPGTLGALEQISFNGEAHGVDIDGSLIAHTWGTETILRVIGLTANDPYNVVLVTEAGDTIASGSFLGSTVTIDCEMNAAVMRDAVTSVEIQDASGTVVATAELPETT
ncbi:hypothetical protein D6T64_18460 [Cryobacterium melibiosiphilum]|uniref:Anti-sigma factor n=1 Tax=Cryobacterium melibiosiphilum TaxID=995039 RepID=A0A3A5MKD7_9MICO|nr:hypothetical protein [Cryobacterium melibiosiphilum]RJT85610.1 hypothetical protein D6T64_18460 [Cryobacterium melibiosiphilum]